VSRVPDNRDAQRLLRWYPAAWRARYGDELVALIEDEHGDHRPPFGAQAEVAWAGVRERARQAAVIGDRRPPAERTWTGALVVLCGWAVFVLGGGAFQRQSEHFVGGVAVGTRTVPVGAFDVVQSLALVGALLVVIGALAAMPAFVRLLRTGGWHQLRRRAGWAIGATAVCAGALVGLAGWAHSLTTAARNGGSIPYSVAFVAMALVAAVTLGLWTALAVAAARRLEVSARLRRTEAALAATLFVVMAAISIAAALWWVEMARSATLILIDHPPGTRPPVITAFMLTAATCMAVGTALAAYGVGRMVAARSRRPA
jgi:hypothetical protein